MSRERPAVQAIDLVKRYPLVRRGQSRKDFWKFFEILKASKGPTISALNKVNFEISRGEIFGLLGPNGAGKTTLIKVLCTLVLPDSGRAFVNGIDVVKRPRKALKVLQAVLAGGGGFERRLTARENLELYATLYGVPREKAEKRIGELLDFVHLRDREDTQFQKFSTGNARRLLLARALLKEASIILFDEPTVGLDPVASSEFRNLIKNELARQEQMTIILSTHNLWEAEEICDRIAVLQNGRVVAIGTPSEIRHAAKDWTSLSVGLAAAFPTRTSVLVDQIRKISGVSSAEISQNKDGGMMLILEGERAMDYNMVFDTLSSLKLKITSLEATRPSLESAFMKLVKEEDQPINEVNTELAQ